MWSKGFLSTSVLGFLLVAGTLSDAPKAGQTTADLPLPIPYENGAPAGFTGSPSDGQTCAKSSCHGGTATLVSGWIYSNIPASGYIPGNTYLMTVTAVDTGRSTFGFELSPQNLSGTLLGTLVDNAGTELRGLGKYITHNNSSTNGQDYKTWTFDWIAPAPNTGQVTFYAAFNGANGNGSSSGDNIYRSSLTVEEDSSFVGVSDPIEKGKTRLVAPNPSTGIIQFGSQIQNGVPIELKVFALDGALVYYATKELPNKQVDLSFLGNGTYIMTLHQNGSTFSSRLVIQH